VRCPSCSAPDDKVVDSRTADDGAAIRRRRQCLSCGRRYTTFERLEEMPLTVIKRSGHREPFVRAKVVAGLEAATKNRPLGLAQLEALAADVEVAYLRFASVYKGFEDLGDFEREVGLLTKATEPKQRG
jgi:transcriptional repressor NrdR